MLYEYAVEPLAIGSSWQTFRYLIEKFGFDKGRLIAEFPKRAWFREVYEAATGFSSTDKARLEILLNKARGTKVIRTGRPYDPEAGDWLYNALTEHKRLPFKAIVARNNASASRDVLVADDVDEESPLMVVASNRLVPRDATSIASALSGFLGHGSRVLFVDPFFNPFNQRYKNTLKECLRVAKMQNPTANCEIHYRYHEDNVVPSDIEKNVTSAFGGLIPSGMSIKVYCWRQKDGGADFHARYLLTEKGGIGVDAGFSAEGAHETTDMHILGLDFCKEKLATFTRPANTYDLVGPVLFIGSDGKVIHI